MLYCIRFQLPAIIERTHKRMPRNHVLKQPAYDAIPPASSNTRMNARTHAMYMLSATHVTINESDISESTMKQCIIIKL